MKNSGNKKVLFLSLSGIGNLLMQLPTIKIVKTAHPDWHITVWVAPRGTAELARSQSYIDEVLEMPIKTGVLQHSKNIAILRARKFDYGIVLSPGQLVKSALYLALAGIPNRIGNKYPLRNTHDSSLFLTDALEEMVDMHDIEQNIRLLQPLGIHIHDQETYTLEIPEKNKGEAEQFISSLPINESTPLYIGIHAGSAQGFEFKQWPLERFAEVAQAMIQKNPSVRFLLFGGPSEGPQKQRLAESINNQHTGFAFPVAASLMTTAAIMQRCSCVLANDSGLMHLAAAAGVSTVGLFGPTDERLTGPRGANSIVIRAHGTTPVYNTERTPFLGSSAHKTMLAITVNQVLDILLVFVP